MRAIYRVFFMLVFVGVPVAMAQEAHAKKAGKVRYKQNTNIDFENRDVDGQFMSPDGRSVDGDKNLYFDSMFDERKSFNKELNRSSKVIR